MFGAIPQLHKNIYKLSFSNRTKILETIPKIHKNLLSIIFETQKTFEAILKVRKQSHK